MDAHVSYMRLLLNDNVAPFTYSDAQLKSAVTITQPGVALPMAVQLAGIMAFRKFPSDTTGGPFTQ